MQTICRVPRRSRKAQSLVEFALAGILLAMLLAASVDLGRVFYTYIVVQNMAGEAATYFASSPDNDCTVNCTQVENTFQGRARNVAARVEGMVISPANVVVTNDNTTSDVTWDVAEFNRCQGIPFNVHVSYHMNDLFFPALLGFNSITLGSSEQARFLISTAIRDCPTPTPLP